MIPVPGPVAYIPTYNKNNISQNGWGYGNGDLRTAVLGHGHMGRPLN